ncbi:hypothetical protein ON010_g7623 [Phytophthora cinnamomi]|nr:hypothetical protein ON010_g7623 [Phytophthora cinnamomi]
MATLVHIDKQVAWGRMIASRRGWTPNHLPPCDDACPLPARFMSSKEEKAAPLRCMFIAISGLLPSGDPTAPPAIHGVRARIRARKAGEWSKVRDDALRAPSCTIQAAHAVPSRRSGSGRYDLLALVTPLLLLGHALDLDNLARGRRRLVRKELRHLETGRERVVEHDALLEGGEEGQEHGDEEHRAEDDPAHPPVVRARHPAHHDVAGLVAVNAELQEPVRGDQDDHSDLDQVNDRDDQQTHASHQEAAARQDELHLAQLLLLEGHFLLDAAGDVATAQQKQHQDKHEAR